MGETVRALNFVLAGALALVLNGCGMAAAYISNHSAPDPIMASCLDRGTYLDAATHKCAAPPKAPPLTPQQRVAAAAFNARVQARAANCMTGSKEMCRIQAQEDEIAQEDFCIRVYKSSAYSVLVYKSIGWPVEMTFKQMAPESGLPLDLLYRLVNAGYHQKWKSNIAFANEAQQRCMHSAPF